MWIRSRGYRGWSCASCKTTSFYTFDRFHLQYVVVPAKPFVAWSCSAHASLLHTKHASWGFHMMSHLQEQPWSNSCWNPHHSKNLWNPLLLVRLPLTVVFQVLKSVASDCLFGVLTVILQSLPAIDYEKGRNETQEFLDIADDLVAIFEQFLDLMIQTCFWAGIFGGIHRLRFAGCWEGSVCDSTICRQRQPDRDDIRSSASSAGWDVDALVRTTRLYRRMLQPIAGEKCQLKVYVYPPPKLKLGEYSVYSEDTDVRYAWKNCW